MQTKEQRKKYMRGYWKKNKERLKEYKKEYNQKPEVKAYRKKYRQRPEVKIAQREYREKHREKHTQYCKEYYQKHKNEIKKQHQEYNQRPEVKQRVMKHGKKYRKKNKEKIRRYLQGNKEKIQIRGREYNQRPEVQARVREYKKKYIQILENKIRKRKNERINSKKRRLKDKNYSIRIRLRNHLGYALNTFTKTGKIMSASKYGINYKAIIKYLKPFPKDLSKYHVDHRKPLCSFNLENPEEIKKAFAPENHQWLLAQENISKGGRY